MHCLCVERNKGIGHNLKKIVRRKLRTQAGRPTKILNTSGSSDILTVLKDAGVRE
jgi:hypothetical protein